MRHRIRGAFSARLVFSISVAMDLHAGGVLGGGTWQVVYFPHLGFLAENWWLWRAAILARVDGASKKEDPRCSTFPSPQRQEGVVGGNDKRQVHFWAEVVKCFRLFFSGGGGKVSVEKVVGNDARAGMRNKGILHFF